MSINKTTLAGVLLVAGSLCVGAAIFNSSASTKSKASIIDVATPLGERVVTNGLVSDKLKVTNLELEGNSTVRLEVPVDARSVALTINAMEQARKSGASRIYLILDSPGGSVLDGVKVINYIKSSPIPVDTICDGICASMAAHIHQAGARRLMTMKSVLMFHPASGGARGTIEQMSNQLAMFKLFIDRLDADVAARSKQDYAKFKARLVSELWIETTDAIAERFADGVVNILGGSLVPSDMFMQKPRETQRRYEITM